MNYDLLERLANDNARLRAQLHSMRCLMQRLLDPEDLGWAVSDEVREIVRGEVGKR